MRLLKTIAALGFTAFLLHAVNVDAAPAAAPPPAVVHPALWTVHGKSGTVYLLGSLHALPPALAWRDSRVEDVIYNADTYVFEVSLDAEAIKKYMAASGSLPPGQSLRAMLPPASQADLDADATSVSLPEANVDGRRPWLVTLVLETLRFAQKGNSPYSGVDYSVMAEVQARGKPMRYLETFEQQMGFLAPSDPKIELASFEAFLKDFKTEDNTLPDMIAAWSAGDVVKLDKLSLGSMAEHPDAKKVLIDDRNKAWLKPIEHMLDSEQGTFLITVGVLHLVGRGGVPALLRADGYKVDGP
jgi:uncharacterized protein YbaP (TraB family)